MTPPAPARPGSLSMKASSGALPFSRACATASRRLRPPRHSPAARAATPVRSRRPSPAVSRRRPVPSSAREARAPRDRLSLLPRSQALEIPQNGENKNFRGYPAGFRTNATRKGTAGGRPRWARRRPAEGGGASNPSPSMRRVGPFRQSSVDSARVAPDSPARNAARLLLIPPRAAPASAPAAPPARQPRPPPRSPSAPARPRIPAPASGRAAGGSRAGRGRWCSGS